MLYLTFNMYLVFSLVFEHQMFIYFLVPKTDICSKVITMIRKRNVLHIFPSKVKQGNPQEIIKTKNNMIIVLYDILLTYFY